MDILERILGAGLPVLGVLAGGAALMYFAGLRNSKPRWPTPGTGRRWTETSSPWRDIRLKRRHQ